MDLDAAVKPGQQEFLDCRLEFIEKRAELFMFALLHVTIGRIYPARFPAFM